MVWLAFFFFLKKDARSPSLALDEDARRRELNGEGRRRERERESQKGKENNIIDREERVRDTETQRYKVDARTKRLLLSVMRDPPPWKPSQPHAVS